jgi:LEA14-like dessication related protein
VIVHTWKKIVLIVTSFVVIIFFGFSYAADVNTVAKISVNLLDVELFELQLTYCKLKLIIEVTNPSDRSITDFSTQFTIYLTNSYVGNGSFSSSIIRGKSAQSNDVIVTIYYNDVATATINSIKQGRFDMQINGTITARILFSILPISQGYTSSHTYF